jgi:hypothetical protein
MKKAYINPVVEIVKVKTNQMIATSQNLYQNQTVNDIRELESRGGYDWDDDYDE